MRHLLSAADLDRDTALTLLDTAAELATVSDRAVKKLPTLRGRTVANVFFEDSTRTRLSFEAAAKRLSADVITFTAKGSSVSKGESLKDTALTLEAMGAEAVVLRHAASGAAYRLAHSGWISASVINAGDGTHEHPTQALLDAFTLRRHLRGGTGDLAGVRIAIVGDILHSRVARSDIHGLTTLGVPEVRAIGPRTLLPGGLEHMGVRVFNDMNEGLKGVDVIIMLRLQNERMNGALLPSAQEYFKSYGLTPERLALAKSDAIVMHPGPMNRGVEIDSAVADGAQAVILPQVTFGIAVRMAVMSLLAGS